MRVHQLVEILLVAKAVVGEHLHTLKKDTNTEFHQRDDSNKTFPLGFSTAVDGIHNSTGTSLVADEDGHTL